MTYMIETGLIDRTRFELAEPPTFERVSSHSKFPLCCVNPLRHLSVKPNSLPPTKWLYINCTVLAL